MGSTSRFLGGGVSSYAHQTTVNRVQGLPPARAEHTLAERDPIIFENDLPSCRSHQDVTVPRITPTLVTRILQFFLSPLILNPQKTSEKITNKHGPPFFPGTPFARLALSFNVT